MRSFRHEASHYYVVNGVLILEYDRPIGSMGRQYIYVDEPFSSISMIFESKCVNIPWILRYYRNNAADSP